MQVDAFSVLRAETRLNLRKFAAIHASPPCQGYSVARHLQTGKKLRHHRLIETTRFLLKNVPLHTGKSGFVGEPTPWVIENVVGAPLIDPITLCGTSFGLPLTRHRRFESNIPLTGLPCGDHTNAHYNPVGHAYVNTDLRNTVLTADDRRYWASRTREAMGIDWMNRDELKEAIPPAYTELIGNQIWMWLNIHQPDRLGPSGRATLFQTTPIP
jgi:DNA (cytosine-5)-methyltransferase 1